MKAVGEFVVLVIECLLAIALVVVLQVLLPAALLSIVWNWTLPRLFSLPRITMVDALLMQAAVYLICYGLKWLRRKDDDND